MQILDRTPESRRIAMSRKMTVEICVGDLDSALEAERGGADRVELCDNLAVGGTTPGPGTIAVACGRLKIPVHVLIRPRGGDFLHSEAELAAMRLDVEAAKSLGASGVVLGLLTAEATVDRERTARLIELARPMSVTFHKAFDQTRDPFEALDALIELGVDRVLTSGCRPSALEGAGVLAGLVAHAAGRIVVLAGGRLSLQNLRRVVELTDVNEVHLGSAACRKLISPMSPPPRDGSETSWNGVDAAAVREIMESVAAIGI
jgi:copper homeostasis protein